MIACFNFYLLTDFSGLNIHAKLLIFHHQRLFDWFQFFWWFDSNFTFMLSLIKFCMQHGLHLYRLTVQFCHLFDDIQSFCFSFYFLENYDSKAITTTTKKHNCTCDEASVCVCLVIVFIFYSQKLILGNIKKKKFSLVFLKSKTCLVS